MKSAPQRPHSTITRCTSAFWAASFLFFLVYSAPHRVHHFFEQTAPRSHDQSHNDHHQPNHHDNSAPSGSDCVFQVSASRCALSLAPQIDTPIPTESVHILASIGENKSAQSFFTRPFQIRAPPKA